MKESKQSSQKCNLVSRGGRMAEAAAPPACAAVVFECFYNGASHRDILPFIVYTHPAGRLLPGALLKLPKWTGTGSSRKIKYGL